MNIPEITTEVKQGARSESFTPVLAPEKPPVNGDGDRGSTETVNRHSEAGSRQSRQSRSLSRDEIDNLVSDMEDRLASNNVKLTFNILEESNTIQVEVLDSDGNTIRKIPGDEMVKLSKSLKNLDRGFLNKLS